MRIPKVKDIFSLCDFSFRFSKMHPRSAEKAEQYSEDGRRYVLRDVLYELRFPLVNKEKNPR
jgi:hypothetical protein